MLKTKRMSAYLFALLAVLQMAAFFLYNATTEHFEIKWLVYLVYWIRNLAEAIVPLLSAAGMLLLFVKGHKRIWLFPILPILSRVLYYLPDHYLFYIADQLTSAEAITMAAIVTLLECIALYVLTAVCYLIGKAVLRKHEGVDFEEAKIFSLENPFIKSVFFSAFTYFCLQIAMELVRTVSYLFTNAGTYTLEEIVTLILSFIMHFAILLATHALSILYLRYAKKHYTVSE